MPAADASNPIEAVRARLDGGRKWHKGALGHWDDPAASVCVVGASWAVKTQLGIDVYAEAPWGQLLQGVVLEQYVDRCPEAAAVGVSTLNPVPEFNDHPDTTWADVDLVLDKAARRWDEQVRP